LNAAQGLAGRSFSIEWIRPIENFEVAEHFRSLDTSRYLRAEWIIRPVTRRSIFLGDTACTPPSDANVRSVWLCSRNDAIGNIAVMLAALGVWSSRTAWLDVNVASILAFLFLQSATTILRHALVERSGKQTEMVSASGRVQ
jgi:Co/Zn/Cd efflux system component